MKKDEVFNLVEIDRALGSEKIIGALDHDEGKGKIEQLLREHYQESKVYVLRKKRGQDENEKR